MDKKEETKIQVTSPALTIDEIRKYICPEATEQEAYMFLKLCLHQKLNPFLREAYLIKYGNAPATMVVGKETFTKRAEQEPDFDGYEAGIIVQSEGKVIKREGSFYQKEKEKLLGGWARVYRKNHSHPYYNEVSLDEYMQYTKDGQPTKAWAKISATMIRKVPLCQSLREAFPNIFAGLYDFSEMPVEMSIDSDVLPTTPITKKSQIPPLPPSLEETIPVSQPQLHTTEERKKIEKSMRRFFALASSLHWEQAQTKKWIYERAKVTSTKDVTQSQWDVILPELENLLEKSNMLDQELEEVLREVN